MEKLILNSKKLISDKNDKNFFLGKWFVNCLSKDQKKNINFSYFDTENFNFENETKKLNYTKKISKDILNEIIPVLNQLNGVKWKYKIWNIFLGHWLHHFVAVVLDRINLVKPLFKSNINYEEQLSIGKNASLASYNLRDFTRNAGLIEWNEKFISRIIYLISTNNFNNDESLLNSKKNFKSKKENFFTIIKYNCSIAILKFLEKILCKENNYLFYNSYIKNKSKLFKIIVRLGDFPFLYSFPFFNKRKIKKGIDLNLRKKFKINFDSVDLDLKIVKFLLIECLPTIYLEGFKLQKELADNSHLPKKTKVVFTSAVYDDETFKFWLADKMNSGTKLAHGQHGGGAYFILKELFWETFEFEISNKYFNWGARKNNLNPINIGNYLLDTKNENKNINSQKFLVVFAASDLFKRSALIWDYYHYMTDGADQTQTFFDNINFSSVNELNLRLHPQDRLRRELQYSNFIEFKNNKINKVNYKSRFDKLVKKHSLIIFTYLSTEFFKMMALNKPCLVLINKKNIDNLFNAVAKKDFEKLIDVGILHTNGLSLANKLNLISNNIENWWNNKEIIKAKDEFCKNYSNPHFNIDTFINELKILK